MQVSFIVPLYNGLRYTQAMLEGLRATVPPGLEHEIILIDDGSTDGTREWLEGLDPAIRRVANPANVGYARANNRGAALARGEQLVLLNNDLVLARGWLEPLLAAHRGLGSRAGVVGNVQLDARTGAVDHAGMFIDCKGKPEHVRRRPAWLRRLLSGIRPAPAVTGACAVVSRELWRELDGFDEGYVNGGEDVDLCFRAAERGRINAVALRSVVRHHVSVSPGRKRRDEENSRRLARRWQERLVALGQRDWCREHSERYLPEPRDYPDFRLARQALLYRFRLRPTPPQRAEEGMRAALATEFARWKSLLGEE